jgi:hypothetical protein
MSAVVLVGGKVLGRGSNVFVTGTPGFDGTITVGSSGNFVNGHGVTVQLRGANIQQQSIAMLTAAATLSPSGVPDASGGNGGGPSDQPGTNVGNVVTAGPIISLMAPWNFNTIRIGINEASWLGHTVYDTTGVAHNPNNFGAFPGLGYQQQITQQIAAFNAAGYYVILTLALTHAGLLITDGQDSMANQDHSITCWQSMAANYGYPNGTQLKRNGGTINDRSVIFELFNEPFAPDAQIFTGGFYNGYYQNDNPFIHLTGLPVTALGGNFTPGESFTASNGTAGKVANYFANTTTGLASSGTTFLHVFNVTGTNTSGNIFTTAIPLPVGTTITGSTSGATANISNLNSGQFGWYVAGAQQLITAIRAAGAGNVILCSGGNFAKTMGTWLTNMAGTDTTAPAGWVSGGFGAWTSQLGAHWHPYPAFSVINAVTVNGGGSGYAINDTILLPMDESGGANSGGVYWQAQLKVTSVSGTAVTGVSLNAYTGGTPGVSGGNAGQFTGGAAGGVYSNLLLPANPVSLSGSQPGTSGSGATFNLTFNNVSAGSGAEVSNLPGVVAIKTAGYPVSITETGEHTGTGIVASPWMAELTSWADTNGISFVTYAYTPSAGWFNAQGYDFTLALLSTTGSPSHHTPSPGYGVFMFNWFSTHL